MLLLKSLILVSEKAANLARICRQNDHLFQLLIEEKKSEEANPRFVQDFKTLADVLIQETVKHDIGNEFPEIRDHIKGEETNVFCNTLGESIEVEVMKSRNETSELLAKVLNGDNEAADLLSDEIHSTVHINDVNTSSIPNDTDIYINSNNVGIWIDPIDSTTEYIHGNEILGKNKIALSGLKCVTVLIGVYDLATGDPILGIINQPFVENIEDRWRGRCFWGFQNICSLKREICETNIICVSSTENSSIKTKLANHGFVIVEAAGAGYKILTTIVGSADAYLLSKDSTFMWDTCGPQAILRSLGGDIIVYDKSLKKCIESLNYLDGDIKNKIETCCNQGGIIAFRNPKVLEKILDAINQ